MVERVQQASCGILPQDMQPLPKWKQIVNTILSLLLPFKFSISSKNPIRNAKLVDQGASISRGSRLVNAIHRLFFPPSLEKRAAKLIEKIGVNHKEALAWDEIQTNPSLLRKEAEIEEGEVEEAIDPVETFFSDFFRHLTTNYFDVVFIYQIQTTLADSISKTLKSNAKGIAEKIVKDAQFDINDSKSRKLVSKGVAFLLGKDKKKQRKLIKEELKSLKIKKEFLPGYLDIFLDSKCEVDTLVKYIGPHKAKKFIKGLSCQLIPLKIQSDTFISKLNKALYSRLMPLVDRSYRNESDNSISSFVEVIAKIGSSLAAKRLADIYKTFDLKEMFDEAITLASAHLDGHIEADKEVKKIRNRNPLIDPSQQFKLEFLRSKGCHEVTADLIAVEDDESGKPILTSHFNKVSKDIVNRVFDRATIEEFISTLSSKKEFLLENSESPVLKSIIEALLDDSNREIFVTFIDELKVFAQEGLSFGLYQVLINQFLLKGQIYKVIFTNLAPPLIDLVQKAIMKLLVTNLVSQGKDKNKHLQMIHDLYKEYKDDREMDLASSEVVARIVKEYKDQVLKKQPSLIKERLQELATWYVKDLFEELDKKWDPIRDEFKKSLLEILVGQTNNEQVKPYGELIMNVLFGLSDLGYKPVAEIFRKNELLINFFREVFLLGLDYIRHGDDPNSIFFKLISPAVDYYRESENVKALLHAQLIDWDETEIKNEIKKESKEVSLLLYDLLHYVLSNIPTGNALLTPLLALGDRTIGLEGQVDYIFTKLFHTNGLNINLGLHALDIVRRQFIKKL